MIEFDDEKDGSVSIDLCAGEGKMLTISVESSGEIYWALHWDGHRDHGKHKMQKRTWVGLTDEEMLDCLTPLDAEAKRLPLGFKWFAQAIEAKLKEKHEN